MQITDRACELLEENKQKRLRPQQEVKEKRIILPPTNEDVIYSPVFQEMQKEYKTTLENLESTKTQEINEITKEIRDKYNI